jgi:chromatin remodeling complex protein RSC6
MAPSTENTASTIELSPIETINTQFTELFTSLSTFNTNTKQLQNDLKILQRTVKGAARNVKISKKRTQDKLNLSVDLEKFLSVDHGTKLTKAEVMKSVAGYIKTNNLQLKDDKRKFSPNKQMTKIFSMKPTAQLTFVEINKHVSCHLSK